MLSRNAAVKRVRARAQARGGVIGVGRSGMDASAFTEWSHESRAGPTPFPDNGFQFAVPSPGAAPTHLPFGFVLSSEVPLSCAVV